MKSRKDIVLEFVILVSLAAGIICLVFLAAHQIKPPAPKSGSAKFSDITSGTNVHHVLLASPKDCIETDSKGNPLLGLPPGSCGDTGGGDAGLTATNGGSITATTEDPPLCKGETAGGTVFLAPCTAHTPITSNNGPIIFQEGTVGITSATTGSTVWAKVVGDYHTPHWMTVLVFDGNTVYIPGRVTPEEESTPLSLGGHFGYFDLWTHKMGPWMDIVIVSNMDTAGQNDGCVSGNAQNIHSWKPRADGCYPEDAGK